MSDLSIEKQIPYYEQLYYTIKQMIFKGVYKPGDRINETQLAKDFNVSKSPVREAIRLLEKEGLLTVEKSKVVVYQPTLKDVKEIYFCRMALESFAVGFATKDITDEQLEQIEKTLEETELAIKSNQDSNTIIELNEKFHQLILTFTHNQRLQKQVNDLKGLIYFFRVLNFKGENRAENILSQHKEIFKYMKLRDAEQASREMIKHLELDTQHLLETISEM